MTINAKTDLFAVIGDPIEHSLSPVMHNCAFKHTEYNGAYLAFNVKDVKAAMAISLRKGNPSSVHLAHRGFTPITDYLYPRNS